MDKKTEYRCLKKYKHEGEDTIFKVDTGKVYHVIEGRNAWHSTWVVQYEPNSFYSSLPAAKEYAENIRKSGSVFTIIEKPSLIIRSHKKTIIITEINHEKPLADHIFAQSIEYLKNETFEDYRTRAGFLPDFIKGFMATSFGWQRKVQGKNLLTLQHDNPQLKINSLGPNLLARSSSSQGSHYYMSWLESNTKIQSDAVIKIAENLAYILENEKNIQKSVAHIEIDTDKKRRLLKAKIIDHMKSMNIHEDYRQHFTETFLGELQEAYTERAILATQLDNILGMVTDWVDNIGYFSPEDRKKIYVNEAIGNTTRLQFTIRRLSTTS